MYSSYDFLKYSQIAFNAVSTLFLGIASYTTYLYITDHRNAVKQYNQSHESQDVNIDQLYNTSRECASQGSCPARRCPVLKNQFHNTSSSLNCPYLSGKQQNQLSNDGMPPLVDSENNL